MRYIHVVGPHEQFWAGGRYVHYIPDGSETYIEQWAIHRLPDDAFLIRVDRDGRQYDGHSILLEAWRSPDAEGGEIVRFDIHAFGQARDKVRQVRATYQVVDEMLHIGLSLNDAPREYTEMPLDNALLFPVLSPFLGEYLSALSMKGQSDVLRPKLSFDAPLAFTIERYTDKASYLKQDTLTCCGRVFNATAYSWQGDTAWVDETGTLLKIIDDDICRLELMDYARTGYHD
ncbi:MAG: hypothetical protein D6712_10770 [Chloroflexi bacterium]|nr:MAG: hypothetical protein D6712_10770 [Chloroflexota bacterium]